MIQFYPKIILSFFFCLTFVNTRGETPNARGWDAMNYPNFPCRTEEGCNIYKCIITRYPDKCRSLRQVNKFGIYFPKVFASKRAFPRSFEFGLPHRSNGNFTSFCVLKPLICWIPSMELRSSCPDDQILVRDKCYPRYADEFGSRLIPCHPHEFRCAASNKCIPRSWLGDHHVDCSTDDVEDRSDELPHHPAPKCDSETEYRCHDHHHPTTPRCIARHQVMDGRADCRDGSDESHPLTCHHTREYTCHNSSGRCIPRRYVNDDVTDCPAGEDVDVANFTCIERLEFACAENRCIPRRLVGDGAADCGAGEDETAVLTRCFERDEFACLDRRRCLPMNYLCDGVQHCRDGSDEVELCGTAPTMFRRAGEHYKLTPWSEYIDGTGAMPGLNFGLKCYTSLQAIKHVPGTYKLSRRRHTIPQFYVNHNRSVCYSGEDACFDTHGALKCARCFDGTVISRAQLCDGVIDCRDLSDECTCEASALEALCVRVLRTKRYEFDDVCNGVVDMGDDGLDERYCYVAARTNMAALEASKYTNNSYCSDSKPTPHECSSRCINSTSDKGAVIARFEHCFPTLTQQIDNHVINFSTVVINSTGILTEHLADDVTKNVTIIARCEYRLDVRYELFVIDAKPRTRHCGLYNEYHDFNFLCNIGGIRCPWLYFCDSKKMMDMSKRCDFSADCGDGSDERECHKTHFYCTAGRPPFIRRSSVRDGVSDCDDRSDECRETAFASVAEMIKNRFLFCYIWFATVAILVFNVVVVRRHFRKMAPSTSKQSIPFWSTILLLNLACSDLIMGVALLIIGGKSVQFSGRYCRADPGWRSSRACTAVGVLTLVSSQTSLNILVLMTGLRLYTTYKPYQAGEINIRLMTFLTASAWAVSLLVALCPVFMHELFVYAVHVEPNVFLNDHIVSKGALEKYASRTVRLFQHSNPGYDDIAVNPGDLDGLKGWFFNTGAGRGRYPTRRLDVKADFGFYSSSSVCFPDFYSKTRSTANYAFAIIVANLCSLLFICTGYYVILRVMRKRSCDTPRHHGAVTGDSDHRRVMRRIAYVVVTDTLCWLPIIAMAVASYAGCELPEVVHPVSAIVFLPINSYINPVIYSRLDKGIVRKWSEFCDVVYGVYVKFRRRDDVIAVKS